MTPALRMELSRCRPWIEAALARQPLHSFADVEAALAEGRAQLFPGERSVIVTAIEDYPNGERVIDTWLAGGDGEEIAETMRPKVEAWAESQGCTLVTVSGRKGWERMLAPHGYDHFATVLAKRLNPATAQGRIAA